MKTKYGQLSGGQIISVKVDKELYSGLKGAQERLDISWPELLRGLLSDGLERLERIKSRDVQTKEEEE